MKIAHATPTSAMMNIPTSETQAAEDNAVGPPPLSHPNPIARKPGRTAAHAVLFTPELLCNIVSQLPLQEIVVTTGFCHFWRNAVAADPHLLRALFLQPEEVRRVLVFRRLWADFEAIFSQHNPGDVIPEHLCYTIGSLHPLHRKICGLVNTCIGDLVNEWDWNSVNQRFTQGFCHPDRSWRHMFISQPPCQSIQITMEPGWAPGFVHTVRYVDGVRLGGLCDKLRSCLTREMFFKRPRGYPTQKDPILKMRVNITLRCEKYSREGAVLFAETMGIPAQDGVAIFPKKLAWKAATEV